MLILFFRALILYSLVVLAMRIMGKRQIGQLQPFELAITIMISELATIPMQDNGIPLLSGIIPILTIIFAQILFSYINIKNITLRKFLSGKPAVVIKDGKIIQNNLRTEMYTLNDLLEQLRIKGYQTVTDIKTGILETNGELSVFPFPGKKPVTPEILNMSAPNENDPLDLIIDGKIIGESLEAAGLSNGALENMLKQHNISRAEDVFYACLNTDGNFHYQIRE